MRSFEHATIGAVVGALAVSVLARGRSLPTKLALWCYSLVLSVFVDLDHFAIAWLKTGEWSYLRRAVADPVWAFTRQEEVFPDVEMPLERLGSHLLIERVLSTAFRRFSRSLATFTTVVLYAHVLADVLREIELV